MIWARCATGDDNFLAPHLLVHRQVHKRGRMEDTRVAVTCIDVVVQVAGCILLYKRYNLAYLRWAKAPQLLNWSDIFCVKIVVQHVLAQVAEVLGFNCHCCAC